MANYDLVVLMILDGWGLRLAEDGNAIRLGNTPNYDKWQRELECAVVDASGEAVGLVPNQMGNSEVGHLNLGAGRIVYQDISRINNAIKNKEYGAKLGNLLDFANYNKRVHLLGLLGFGGVHAHQTHLYASLDALDAMGAEIVVHVITDGRDTPPNSAIEALHELETYIADNNINAVIATVSGRYYIMDRDKRWERTRKAYEAIVLGEGQTAESPNDAIEKSYAQDVTDEFILPTVVNSDYTIQNGDQLFFFNFRADRVRQIVQMLTAEDFEPREHPFLDKLNVVTMTEYSDEFPVKVLFPMETVQNTLAETLSKNGKTQFHIAETEKYPHVTYFFNGRNEEQFEGEDRDIVPSPKVATYDLQPEMSAPEVRDTVLKRLAEHDDNFILINFANPDMVGHTGVLEAAIKAVETVDGCATEIAEAVMAKGGAVIVTADHGNSEVMLDYSTGGAHTYHTTQPVPLFVMSADHRFVLYPRGILADVAPTVLDLLGIEKPADMTGTSLVKL